MEIFSELRILELSSVLAGPSVGMFFAELGAEVIKIENPITGGDVTRSWKLSAEDQSTDLSSYFCSVNWGKKSIALNLREKKDYTVFKKLVKVSDIITVSYKPGDDKKLNLDYNSIKEINSKIIYAQITGFGSEDQRTAFDAVIQAYSGFMYMNGTPESGPIKMPVALIDILAAHQIKEAILVAIIKKNKTGKGSYIDCSLLQSGISSLANQASNYLNADVIPQRTGSDHPNIFPYGTLFKTKDNKQIMLAIGNDTQFRKFCELTDSNYLLTGDKFSTNPKRVQNRETLKKLLCGIIEKWDSKELITRLDDNKIPAALVLDIKEVFEQKQAQELILHQNISDKTYYGVRTFCAQLDRGQTSSLSAPPHLDENRKYILETYT